MMHLQNPVHGLRSPGILAGFPIIGLAMTVLGGLTFGLLAYSLRANDALLQWDMQVAKSFRLAQIHAPWNRMEDLLFGCFVGKEVVALIGAVLSAYFLHRRFWRELAMVLTGLAGGALIWYVLSRYFDRPRPPEQLGLATSAIPSFPSGHALGTLIGYGFLAYLLIPRMPSRFWKWTAGFTILLLVLFEGFSRIFHGNHYLTDVLAAYALGIAWLALICTVIESIFPKKQN